MSQGNLIFGVVAIAAGAIIVIVVLSLKQKSVVSGFLAAARRQALKSRASLELSQGKNPKLTLSVRGVDRGQFEVRREGAADRLVESLSLARPIRTADPSFSDRFHVDSDDESFASAYFADGGKRAAVEALFATGCTALEWDEGHATAVWEGFAPKDENAEFVGAAAAALRALTLNVPASAPARLESSGWSERTFNSVTGAAMVAGFMAAYVTTVFGRSMYGRPVDGWEMFAASLRLSLPAAAVCVAVGAARIAGKTWFLRGASRLALASALAFPSMGYVCRCLWNSVLDDGPAANYVLPVTSKSRGSGRHPSYYVHVKSWRPELYSPRFDVDRATYDRVNAGTTQARLTTRPGRLGNEWVVSLEFTGS